MSDSSDQYANVGSRRFRGPLGTRVIGIVFIVSAIVAMVICIALLLPSSSADKEISNKQNFQVCSTEECKKSASTLLQDMDLSADPCVDFYQFSCGGYYRDHPANGTSSGKFSEASDLIHKRLKKILESESDPRDAAPLRKMRTFYAACLDTDTMDELGFGPLMEQLNGQGGWPMVTSEWKQSNFDLETALAHIRKIKTHPLVKVAITSDFLNTSRKILYISEGDLGESEKFLRRPNVYRREIVAYTSLVVDSAKLVRDDIGSEVLDQTIERDAQDMVNFEIRLAKIMDLRKKDKTDVYGRDDVAGLQKITDGKTKGEFDWLRYLRILFSDTVIKVDSGEPLYMYGKSYFTDLSKLLSQTTPRTVANYIGWLWVQKTGPETTYAMRNLTFEYENKPKHFDFQAYRTAHCIGQTETHLDFPLSRAYVDEYFSPKAKKQTTILVELIREAFQELLDKNGWMPEEDLSTAKEKLDAIVDYVAYPDWIMKDPIFESYYQKLNLVVGRHFENLMDLGDFYNTRKLALFRISEKKVFVMSPTVINAFYDIFSNQISVLAGILQAPFYQQDSIAALNFGGIGVIVGHELTHGFDNTGRKFDKDGNLASWWSDETVEAFEKKAECFVDQYNNFYPPEIQGNSFKNTSVNGKQTLGENIADNGGIRESFRAYRSYVEKFGEEPRLPGLEQFSPEQLFFIGFGNVWCEHKTTNDISTQISSDPHSPGRFRVIGSVSNSEDFSRTFNCPSDSPMNRGNQRCVLW